MKRWLIVLMVAVGGVGFPAARAAADPKMPPREQRFSTGNKPAVAHSSSGRSKARAHHGSADHRGSSHFRPHHHGAYRHFHYSPYGYGYRYYRYPYSYPYYYRPSEVDLLLGDASKAEAKLGWKPRVSFQKLVHIMTDHDLDLAQREAHMSTYVSK